MDVRVGAYRFGFNGKEKDQNGEWGELTHYDYGFRIYNPGIGRFLSVDPLAPQYPWYTPYQFAGNTPIWAIDLEGAEPEIIHNRRYRGDDGVTVIVKVQDQDVSTMTPKLEENHIKVGTNVIRQPRNASTIMRREEQFYTWSHYGGFDIVATYLPPVNIANRRVATLTSIATLAPPPLNIIREEPDLIPIPFISKPPPSSRKPRPPLTVGQINSIPGEIGIIPLTKEGQPGASFDPNIERNRHLIPNIGRLLKQTENLRSINQFDIRIRLPIENIDPEALAPYLHGIQKDVIPDLRQYLKDNFDIQSEIHIRVLDRQEDQSSIEIIPREN